MASVSLPIRTQNDLPFRVVGQGGDDQTVIFNHLLVFCSLITLDYLFNIQMAVVCESGKFHCLISKFGGHFKDFFDLHIQKRGGKQTNFHSIFPFGINFVVLFFRSGASLRSKYPAIALDPDFHYIMQISGCTSWMG